MPIEKIRMDLASKRILVTGGGGFLGSHIVGRLRAMGCCRVTAPRRREFDLTRADAIERLLRECRPEIVIHAAATVGGIGANKDNPGLFFYENAIMGIQLIEASRVHVVEKTIVLGTICAYPKFTPVPFREEALWDGYPEETNAPYGIAKKALLVQCQAYREQYGMNAIFLLPVNLYGPRDHFDLQSSHVIPALIRKCIEAKERGDPAIVLWGDGSPTREFLYVEDAAEAVIKATELYDGAEPVNIGSGAEISIKELAEKIGWLTDYSGQILWDASKPNGQPRRQLEVSRAERCFGFRAHTALEAGLRATVEWYRSNREG
jgi:GDP-L-fucose synthase